VPNLPLFSVHGFVPVFSVGMKYKKKLSVVAFDTLRQYLHTFTIL
jgi:hypothetical protein